MYLEQDDLKRARKVCDIGLKHHKNNSAGLFILAQVEKENGNYKETEKSLERVLLYTHDHFAAAEMLCEIQTVLGRASNRLLKSWKHVLSLNPDHKTAQNFISKIEGADIIPESKTSLKPQGSTTVKPIQKEAQPVKNMPVAHPVSIEPKEPLKVSSRLATFTLVAVLKNQGLFEQALDVLDALVEKGENLESISLERDTIHTLIQNSKKD
jgi:tetratricopeptide (TPR) repeat protein